MRKLSAPTAFSLVEVTLALGIAAVCLVAVIGIIPVGVQTNRNATSQTAATNIMAAVIADLRATPKGNPTSIQFGVNVPTDARNGAAQNCLPCAACWTAQTQTFYFDSQGQPVVQANGRYRLSVTSVANPTATAVGGAAFGAVFMALKVTWPASVDPCVVTPGGSIQSSAMLD